jgi:hypothetical protein
LSSGFTLSHQPQWSGIDAVLRGLGPAFEMYVQRFKDNGLESFEDLNGLSADALSDELMRMGVTELKPHANKMARELVKARPSGS